MILYFPQWIKQQLCPVGDFLKVGIKNSCCSEHQFSKENNESLGRITDCLVRNQVGCTFQVGERLRRNESWLLRPEELAN